MAAKPEMPSENVNQLWQYPSSQHSCVEYL